MEAPMGLFRRKVPNHYIPIHPDNVTKRDWLILLEAGTIVGQRPEKLRVALATVEKKIVRRYNVFLQPKSFLVLPGYDPRIHALYFCPQLYSYDTDSALIPLEGEEIGKLVAQAVQESVVEKQPWYKPSDQLPSHSVISESAQMDFDTVVVDTRNDWNPSVVSSPEEAEPVDHAA
jgi:hypothetical protein